MRIEINNSIITNQELLKNVLKRNYDTVLRFFEYDSTTKICYIKELGKSGNENDYKNARNCIEKIDTNQNDNTILNALRDIFNKYDYNSDRTIGVPYNEKYYYFLRSAVRIR